MFQVLSSCPKHNCNCGRPFPLAKRKNNFSGPEKLFFIFTFQAPLRAASELFRCFSSCPKHNRPFPLAKRKNNFSGPEKLFFIFTFQAPLRAASELCRCFSSCPKRNCNCGRPFHYRKGGMVRQRIRKIRSDAGKSRAKYKRQLAKPEHARLLSTASCGFSAPEEGVIVSTILDEMSPPKRSKT